MARGLSTTQRIAIRQIADGRGTDGLTAATINSLSRHGLIDADTGALTSAGRAAHGRIMESGDGPEDLKARLNFGGGSRW